MGRLLWSVFALSGTRHLPEFGITHLLTSLISPADGWCFPPPSLLDALINPDMSQVKTPATAWGKYMDSFDVSIFKGKDRL
ncbi:MAG: hypothetical protein HRU41_31640 [Saprospiraceae bacterium]|nr:hypothetical protein [Saprospiraceae bacterium]